MSDIKSQMGDAYTLEDIEVTRYHGKETSPHEAFAYLRELIPRKENTLLFQKRKNFLDIIKTNYINELRERA